MLLTPLAKYLNLWNLLGMIVSICRCDDSSGKSDNIGCRTTDFVEAVRAMQYEMT
jgi:hypothetical protein